MLEIRQVEGHFIRWKSKEPCNSEGFQAFGICTRFTKHSRRGVREVGGSVTPKLKDNTGDEDRDADVQDADRLRSEYDGGKQDADCLRSEYDGGKQDADRLRSEYDGGKGGV